MPICHRLPQTRMRRLFKERGPVHMSCAASGFRNAECEFQGSQDYPSFPVFEHILAVPSSKFRPESGLALSHFAGKSLSKLSNCSLLAGQREYPSSLSLFLSRSISLSLSRVHHFYFETSPLSTACLGEQRSAKREDLYRTYDVGP